MPFDRAGGQKPLVWRGRIFLWPVFSWPPSSASRLEASRGCGICGLRSVLQHPGWRRSIELLDQIVSDISQPFTEENDGRAGN